jgi:hypothetical protein
MNRTVLSQNGYSLAEHRSDISLCTNILQNAADFVFSLPVLVQGTYYIPSQDDQAEHRVIIAESATLLLERPYMVGFYGVRSLDPGGEHTKDLLSVDNRLIESLHEFGIGLYNTARMNGEYLNTALLPDRQASQQWGLDNSVHQAAVSKLAPVCYTRVLKFTGYVDGWPLACRVDVDEVIVME